LVCQPRSIAHQPELSTLQVKVGGLNIIQDFRDLRVLIGYQNHADD
jgi:hypothetical protein